MRRTAILLALVLATAAWGDYLGRKKIDGYVYIPAGTHRFSTGGVYEATTLTYSIYKDGSATGIVEGVDMVPGTPFDGETGAALVGVQLTAAAGYAVGDYQVKVKAVVDGVTAIAWHNFEIEAAVPVANVTQWNSTAVASPDTAGYPVVTVKDGTGAGEINTNAGNLAGSVASVTGAVGSVSGAVGSVTGDVGGKVLGGGASSITGTGARVVDASGNNVAPATTALSNATWTDAKAGYLDIAVSSRLASSGYTAPLTAATVIDGSITLDETLECLLAQSLGKATISDVGSTRTITYYKADGVTPRFSISVSRVNGARSAGGDLTP